MSQTPEIFYYPSPTPSVSSTSQNTEGIVWLIDNGMWASGCCAVLHAYDATNLSNELYNSNQYCTRDQLGGAVKFTVPTIANGHVYVGGVNRLDVFGLLTTKDFCLTASPSTQTLTSSGSVHYTVDVSALNGFSGSVSLSVPSNCADLAKELSCSLQPTSITGSGSSTLTVTSQGYPETVNITVTGTSGSTQHSTTVQLKVCINGYCG